MCAFVTGYFHYRRTCVCKCVRAFVFVHVCVCVSECASVCVYVLTEYEKTHDCK